MQKLDRLISIVYGPIPQTWARFQKDTLPGAVGPPAPTSDPAVRWRGDSWSRPAAGAYPRTAATRALVVRFRQGRGWRA